MQFDIDELEVKVGDKKVMLWVSGELEYEIEEGQSGTWEDPPYADQYEITHVSFDKVETEDGTSVTVDDLDEWVISWFEGVDGQQILKDHAQSEYDDALVQRHLSNQELWND